MNSNRPRSEPAKPEIERFLTRETQAVARDMLRAFHEGANEEHFNSFIAVAAALGTDKRTVSRELRRLNSRFEAMAGGPLMVRVGLQYQLTPAGRLIGEELTTQHLNLMEAVRRATKTHKEERIPVTENLLEQLSKLQDRLRVGKEKIELYPSPKRSADLLPPVFRRDDSRPRPKPFPYAMYSVCADASDLHMNRVGKLPTDDGSDVDVAVINIEGFKIMADKRSFGDADSLSVGDIWSSNHQFVVPDGGAVRTFLSLVEPDWERRRGYTEATDYSFCEACLVNGSVPNPAMIVHGSREAVKGFALYGVTDRPELKAVSGVFRRVALANRERPITKQIWDTVWAAAVAEFADAATESGAA